MTHWPLRDPVLRTPGLELCPDGDAGLDGLVEVAYEGVHPPTEMPFMVPWPDADLRYLGRGVLQYFWSPRAALAPEGWTINFMVRHSGRVVGTQSLTGTDFVVTREVRTGSWLGMAHQGAGLGTEMRADVLLLAFDHLGARAARSDAFADNHASLCVSAMLGYRTDSTETACAAVSAPTTCGWSSTPTGSSDRAGLCTATVSTPVAGCSPTKPKPAHVDAVRGQRGRWWRDAGRRACRRRPRAGEVRRRWRRSRGGRRPA